MILPYSKRKSRQMVDLSRKVTVDRANSRVGIGSTIPKTKLDVGGSINTTEIFATNINVQSANKATSLNNPTSINSTGIITATSFTGIGSAVTGVGFTSVAIVYDEKDKAVTGGTFSSGAWRTRDLNKISYSGGYGDASTEKFVTLSSENDNQFDLVAGSYLIEWQCPAYRIDGHQSRLNQLGVGATSTNERFFHGTNNYEQNSAYGTMNTSIGVAYTTITDTGYYTIGHRCTSSEGSSGNGFGVSNSQTNQVSDDDIRAIFSIIKIYKF
tara:strand:+ start:718 stop:1527 length:810 start_codon:yes stop_codon:yes gene_type:complete